jgi:acyl transferase domain-containing protein/acyl carrier protein
MSNTLSYSQGTYRVGDAALFVCSSSSRLELLEQLRAIKGNARSSLDPSTGVAHSPATSKHRLAIVSKSSEDFATKLELAISRLASEDSRLNLGQEVLYGLTADYDHLRMTAFVFPGLGVPTQAMFHDLHSRFPVVRRWFDRIQASELAHFQQRVPILPEGEVINEFDTPSDEEMRQFGSMQEMLLANIAVFKLLQSVGLSADSMVGHSHGEQALLLASGMVKSSAEMFYLLRRIARATIVSSRGPGLATLAVATTARFTADDLIRACGSSVVVALDNCPGQRVVCGPSDAIASVADAVRLSGGLCFPMPGLSQPVHTPNFPVNERRLRKIYGEIGIGPASVPAYSCTSATPFPSHAAEIRELLVQQWLRPVRFHETVQRLYQDGVRTFVEVGPGKVTGFVRDILRNTDAIALALHQEGRSTVHQLKLTLAKLFVRGHDLDLSTMMDGEQDANDEIVISTADVRLRQPTGILEIVLRHLARLIDVEESDPSEALHPRRGFFEMGLTSLGAVELAGRLSEECGVALADTAAFEFPSPESLAGYIERQQRGISEPSPAESRLSTPLHGAHDDIAIIGMGLRLPGGANSPKEFWELLREGRDAVVEVPQGRWDGNEDWDKAVRSGGFLQEVDGFDAAFFGISPREAETLDPQQRLLLEVSWEALENAGINPETLRQSRTGVFCGISSNDYAMRLSSAERLSINGYIGTGNAASIAVGRISYLLGLNGPCLAVDTACSSSLVAVHLACQSLRLHESDAAIAGGVNLLLSPETSLFLQYGQALSETGRCRTFDASADGYVRAEGGGAVVLKRLHDAVVDGDRICAVIRGSAVNHDGQSSGLTVPNGSAQEAVLRTALQAACVDPLDVDYVEAHGTGTPLGDPIEVRALSAVYCAQRSPDKPLRLGSVKTNVGHLEAAAGITALIKVVLQLQRQTFAPSLHFSSPNPRIPWQESALEVCVRLSPWETPRRIAGVSSFGMSGTNAHVLVQSAPDPVEPVETAPTARSQLLMLSAQSKPALRHLETAYARLQGLSAGSSFQALCYTANVGRAQFRYRRAVVGRDLEAMQSALQYAPSDERRRKRPKIAFLFSGQGSQTLDMGRQFYAVNQRFRQVLQECDEILRNERGIPLLKILFESSEEVLQTGLLQPALFAMEYALAQTWKSWGIDPDFVVGHSVGEYAAACHAGVMPLRSALLLVSVRGACMESIRDRGGMLAVRASEEEVRRLIDIDDRALSFAAVNGPQNVVLSGADGAIHQAKEVLDLDGIACMPLKVSHAFHSSQMDSALETFQKTAAGMVFEVPKIPWISTVSGRLAGSEVLGTEYWTRQIRQTVRFGDAMKTLVENGVEAFLEIGPRSVLVGLGHVVIGEPQQLWLASLHPPRDEDEQMLSSLGRLYEAGFDIDLKGFYGTERYAAVELPTYPFERTRYWMTVSSGLSRGAHKVEAKLSGSLLGEPMDLPGGRDLRFEAEVVTESLQDDYRVFGIAALPVSTGLAIAVAMISRVGGSGAVLLEEFMPKSVFNLEGLERLSIQTIVAPEDETCYRLEIHSRGGDGWEQKASCCVRAVTSPSTGRETFPGDEDLPSIDVAQFYDSSASMGFAYGIDLQVLERLAAGNGRAVGVVTRRGDSQDPTQWPLFEGCFQVLGAALYLRGNVDAGSYYSPARIGAVRLEHELPNRFFAMASCAELTDGIVGRLSLFEFDSKKWFGEISDVLYIPVEIQESETRDVSVPAWKTCDEGEQPGLIRDHLQGILCRILRRSNVSSIEIEEPFQRFGMDSLMATEFSNTLQRELGVRLPVVHFIGESSLETLSHEVMTKLREIIMSEETVEWVEGVL